MRRASTGVDDIQQRKFLRVYRSQMSIHIHKLGVVPHSSRVLAGTYVRICADHWLSDWVAFFVVLPLSPRLFWISHPIAVRPRAIDACLSACHTYSTKHNPHDGLIRLSKRLRTSGGERTSETTYCVSLMLDASGM